MTEFRGKHSTDNNMRYNADLRPSSEKSVDTSPGRRASSHAFLHVKPSPRARRKAAKQITSSYDTSLIKKQTAKSHVAIALIIVFVLLGVLAFGAASFFGLFEQDSVKTGQRVELTIAEGSTAKNIAEQLKNENVIASISEFLSAITAAEATDKLKPGSYLFTAGAPYDKLIALLTSGPNAESNTLTIPEGLTIAKTAAIVEKSLGLRAADFEAACKAVDDYRGSYGFLSDPNIKTLEGYLYPKTYKIKTDATVDDVVRALLDQFEIETSDLDLEYAAARNLSFYDVVTIASLIENETAKSKERELVASVIYNRLSDGMKLQIDATVVYALGSKHKEGAALSWDDIEVASPYNTYKVAGLPAGPICSPRLESIEAAAHPKETDYLYYVLKSKDGAHKFCTTSAQFEKAKAAYEKLFGIN